MTTPYHSNYTGEEIDAAVAAILQESSGAETVATVAESLAAHAAETSTAHGLGASAFHEEDYYVVNDSNAAGLQGEPGPQGETGATGPAGTFAHSVLTYAASVEVDFAGDNYKTLGLTGNVTLTTSNRSAPKAVAIRIIADGTLRTFTFPAGWVWIGAAAPANIAASKTAILSLTCFGTADTDVIAAYAVQP